MAFGRSAWFSQGGRNPPGRPDSTQSVLAPSHPEFARALARRMQFDEARFPRDEGKLDAAAEASSGYGDLDRSDHA